MRRLKIGLDGYPLAGKHMTGIPRYVDSLMREFLRSGTDDEIVLVMSRGPLADQRAGLERHQIDWRDDPRLRMSSNWYDFRLGARFPALRRPPAGWLTRKIDGRVMDRLNQALAGRRPIEPLDVFHHTNAVSFGSLPASHHVLTIYDLSPRLHPETHEPDVLASHERSYAFARDRASCVITISECTRRDVIEHLQIPEERVRAVPLAVRDSLPRNLPNEAVQAVRERFGLRDTRYVLAGGSLEPRKNLPRLIEAFAQLIDAQPQMKDLRLVLAGAHWHGANAVQEAIQQHGLAERVLVTGYVSDVELAALMQGCACFAYVSLYEGFGLPVLEAMALGAPVVTSNTSSLPEVAGDAALLVEPESTEAIADALARVLGDGVLACDLRARGRERERQFSWARTAQEHLQIYHQVAES